MTNTLPTLDPQNFKRDFVIGDQGDDVAQMQGVLSALGFPPSEEEIQAKKYGESTREAAQKLFTEMQNNSGLGGMLRKFLLQYLFGIDEAELNPAYASGTGVPIRNYRSSDIIHLQAREAGVLDPKGVSRAANIAAAFIGEREVGDNRGPAVQLFCNQQGVPWCGGFVHYVMSQGISPKLYNQGNFLSARSYAEEAKRHDAFRQPESGYRPHVGDVVVFDRGAGKGHVGIVSNVSDDGIVTYIAGNDGDAVRAKTFDAKRPPQGLLGYSDTQALAKDKGIDLGKPQAHAGVNVVAMRHSARSFAHG